MRGRIDETKARVQNFLMPFPLFTLVFICTALFAAEPKPFDVCRIFDGESSRREALRAIAEFQKDPATPYAAQKGYLAKSLGSGTCVSENLYFTKDKAVALAPATYGNPTTIPMICNYNGCGFGAKLWPFRHAGRLYVLLTDGSMDLDQTKSDELALELALHGREIYQLDGASLILACHPAQFLDEDHSYPDLVRGDKETCRGVNLAEDRLSKDFRAGASEVVKDTPPKLLTRLREKNPARQRTKNTFEEYRLTLSAPIQNVDGRRQSGRVLFTSLSSSAGCGCDIDGLFPTDDAGVLSDYSSATRALILKVNDNLECGDHLSLVQVKDEVWLKKEGRSRKVEFFPLSHPQKNSCLFTKSPRSIMAPIAPKP